MGTRAEELSTTPKDIEATRAELSRDIDELSDKVSPQRVVERRKAAVRTRMHSMRERVMGSGSSARTGMTEQASSAAGSVSGAAHSAVGTLESRIEGNPWGAGLVAFGTGMVISALLPPSRKETQAAGRLVEAAKEHGQPVVEEAKSVAQEMGESLKESAQQAAQEVRSTAQDSAQTVKDETTSAAQSIRARPAGSDHQEP